MAPPPAEAQTLVKRVLIIHGGPESFPGSAEYDAALRRILFSHRGIQVEAHSEYLETEEFADLAEASLRETIRIKFRDRPLDLVIANTAPVLRFALRHRDELFANRPIVFAANGPPAEVLRGEVPAITGIVRNGLQAETLDMALTLHPRTRRVHVVAYAPAVEGFRERTEASFAPFSQRVRLTYDGSSSLAEALDVVRKLPPDSLLFFVRFTPRSEGQVIFPSELLPSFAEASPVPVYTSGSDTSIGQGGVGGVMRSGDGGSRLAAMALQILEGQKPESIPIEKQEETAIFDWRQIKRWGLDPASLPPGSEIRFRVPTVWELYGFYVLGMVVVVSGQLLLIVALLYQLRARRRAEIENRRNLALAADASRRETVSALSGSMAHELGQPLSAMMHNAQALHIMAIADRAAPETVGEIASDIYTQGVQAAQIIDRHRTMLRSRQLRMMPFDLCVAVKESLALVAHDLQARQIQTTVNLTSNPSIISGDQVLMQQVLVNLIMNAMDAMADTRPDQRHLTISIEARGADIEIAVRDTGTGLPAHIDGQLFAPFVTTKPHGLGIGLTIVQAIVDAHHGTIAARRNPDRGATFAVTLRRTDATESRAESPSARSQALDARAVHDGDAAR